MTKETVIQIERSGKNYPVMWEEGGGTTNQGKAIIISDQNGKKLQPVYVRKKGNRSNDKHALFIIKQGYMVFEAEHKRSDFQIKIQRINKVGVSGVRVELIYYFKNNAWDVEPHQWYHDAIEAIKEKAICYHCRETHYSIEMEKQA